MLESLKVERKFYMGVGKIKPLKLGNSTPLLTATASVMNLLLAAHARGLSTCWVGAFDENAVSEILGIPHKTRPVAIIPLGYADEAPAAPPRMGRDRVVHQETW